MRISTRGVYALEAMLAISLQPSADKISVRTISDQTGLSDSYLEQIITLLKRAGLVISTRGNRGGYNLARPTGQITVGDVLRAAEGSLSPVFCTIEGTESCERYDTCLTRPIWLALGSEINEFVDHLTLADLVGRYHQGYYEQAADFMI
jgi:Rrf2 family protein